MTKEEARRALEALGDKRPEPDESKQYILGPSGKCHPTEPAVQEIPLHLPRVRRCPFCRVNLTLPVEYRRHNCDEAPDGLGEPIRASGDVECPCGLLYRDHPYDWEQLRGDCLSLGPFLHILCDGTRVKL